MSVFPILVKYLTSITYLGIFFLRIFHYGFIFRRPAAIILECIPTVVISGFLILIVILCERKILMPFEDAMRRTKKSGQRMSEKDYAKCMDAYKKFDVAVAIGEGTGFLLGSSSTYIVGVLKGQNAFEVLIFIIMVAQSVGVGFICYTIVVFRVKKILMTQMLRDVGVPVNTDLSKTLSVAITACVYISLFNMMTVPIGTLMGKASGNLLNTFLVDSVIGGGLTGIVCYVTYSLLVKKIQENSKVISKKLYLETANLAVATKESAATCADQSSAVKEVVSSMEDANNLALNIKEKVQSVSNMTGQAKDDVLSGVEYLDRNVKELLEIMETNKQTIEGIKALGDKVNNVWEVVNIINDVASQAKIIAFNAELEASSAGEYGKNFHIVASEVRRLSDNIIESTKEIKEKIDEIQAASDSLVMVSESGSVKINSGYESIKSLQSKFLNIKESAENTAKNSNAITDFISQLSASNEQVFMTIKQISVGIENFTQTTESISSSSQSVKQIAQLL